MLQDIECALPKTLLMIPMHGFASCWFGRRTFNLGSGGSRGATAGLGTLEGRGGMAVAGYDMNVLSVKDAKAKVHLSIT